MVSTLPFHYYLIELYTPTITTHIIINFMGNICAKPDDKEPTVERANSQGQRITSALRALPLTQMTVKLKKSVKSESF